MINYQNKYLLAIIQVAVFLISAYYIYSVASQNLSSIKTHEIPHIELLYFILLVSCLVYIVLMVFLSWSWQALTRSNHPQQMVEIYLKSQALKYLPGNIFHFAYRHAAAVKLGLNHKALTTAAIHETIWLVASSLLLALISIGLFPETIAPEFLQPVFNWFGLSAVLMTILLFYLLYRNYPIRLYIQLLLTYTSYFAGMGLICLIIASGLGLENSHYLLLTVVFAVSWLVGYVVPGAPGGLGVRESIFTLIMSQYMDAHLTLILITTVRLISTLSEVFIYFFAKKLSQTIAYLWVWSDRTKQ